MVVAPPETCCRSIPPGTTSSSRRAPTSSAARCRPCPGSTQPAPSPGRPARSSCSGRSGSPSPPRPDGGTVEHALAWVNRYVVERVEADIELGFFFPGADVEGDQRLHADDARGARPPSVPRSVQPPRSTRVPGDPPDRRVERPQGRVHPQVDVPVEVVVHAMRGRVRLAHLGDPGHRRDRRLERGVDPQADRGVDRRTQAGGLVGVRARPSAARRCRRSAGPRPGSGTRRRRPAARGARPSSASRSARRPPAGRRRAPRGSPGRGGRGCGRRPSR